ncbi:MAG: carotenoid biosynthesis protein [Gemmatimonadaceae bacterium]
MSDTTRRLARRLVAPLLVGHVAIILFSTIALTTFLAGAPPSWMQEGVNATIARWGWRLSGPTYVVLGALAALAHAYGHTRGRRALSLFALGAGLSLASELLGTSSGIPFGAYSYTTLLGWRVAGLVPFPIPLSWFFMIYCAVSLVARTAPGDDDWRTQLLWASAAGLVLTAWDVSMDPAMSFATAHWVWHVRGAYYGMPWVNWFGWWLTGSIIAWCYLRIVSPREWTRTIARSRFPLVLYAINGVMPIAICARHEMFGAAMLGAAAMMLPIGLATVSGRRYAMRKGVSFAR